MEKVFKMNENVLLNGSHLVQTENGWVETQNLKKGDVVIGENGKTEITKIIECIEKERIDPIGEL